MSESKACLEKLKEIQDEKENYVIYLDNDTIHISHKENDLYSSSYSVSTYEVLWELLTHQGYEVEEG